MCTADVKVELFRAFLYSFVTLPDLVELEIV